ncbi:Protein of unknown function [Cotesia congregata]|uniref:Uncharacterized protein n=1 Tax=Cotesia congregata TaxID=51543 RepID=A0A8J2HHC4_COTCN|nr:Protein of unknown function [Cotesia congregata]
MFCDCSPRCVSKMDDPLVEIVTVIERTILLCKDVIRQERYMVHYTHLVVKGMSLERFIKLKCRWLQAKITRTSCTIDLYKDIKYLEECKAAQAVMNNFLEDVCFEYFVLRKKYAKAVDKLLSLGDQIFEIYDEDADRRNLIIFQKRYSELKGKI